MLVLKVLMYWTLLSFPICILIGKCISFGMNGPKLQPAHIWPVEPKRVSRVDLGEQLR